MQIVLTIDDIRINNWTVDVPNARVLVHYDMLTSANDVYRSEMAIFWATLPSHDVDPWGNEIPIPDNWYQLPAEYVQVLTQLTVDARQALLPRIA